MTTEQHAMTVAVKCCSSCAGALLCSDLFCRWCGVRQPADASSGLSVGYEHSSVDLRTGPQEGGLCNRVSGPLINAVIGGMTPHVSSSARASLLRASILAVVAIPMWLMIVLLSPFDAYAAARSLARQI
jgi:hypothetical protein